MEMILLTRLMTVGILFFWITGCNNGIKPPFDSKGFYNADPKTDAERAISKGDLHVYAVYGHNPYTPEIKRGCLKEEYIIPIKGTSDAIEKYKHAQFNALASLYAEHYNFQIKAYLIRKGNKCLKW